MLVVLVQLMEWGKVWVLVLDRNNQAKTMALVRVTRADWSWSVLLWVVRMMVVVLTGQ